MRGLRRYLLINAHYRTISLISLESNSGVIIVYAATKTTHRRIWLTIKSCCETDAYSADQLLQAAELTLVGENMRCILDKTTGEIFNVPNFCIIDPVYERDFNVYNSKEIKEKKINIFLFNLRTNSQIELNVSNKMNGKELKSAYVEKVGIDLNKFRIRMLCKGQEIKDELCLYHFNLDNNSHIHVSLSEIEN